jgi:hypothetical protein
MRKLSISTAALLLLILVSGGCGNQPLGGVTPRDTGEGLLAPAAEDARLNESLFKDDQAVISNEDVQRILAARIAMPQHGKMAVVRAGRLPYWFGWAEDFTRLNRQIDQQFLDKVQSSPRIKQAMYLPTMAMPKDLSIPYLRQSAARFQADWLLVYRTYSRTYDHQKLFGSDETKAYATLEAILIDTRTGVIPFSTIVTEDFYAQKQKSEVDFDETVAKAEQQAIAKAQMQMADQLVTFAETIE